MDTSFRKKPKGTAEEILREALERGRAQGRTEVRQDSVVRVLEARGIEVPHCDRQRIRCCVSPDLLRTWLIRAVTAKSSAEVIRLDRAS